MTKTAFPLPQDWRDAVLVGRIDMGEGPTPVVVKEGRVFDVSQTAPTVSALLEKWNGVTPKDIGGKDLGDINDLGLETAWADKNGGGNPKVKLLAPVDLQCVKAAGVTFAVSAMERVIEERAKGVPGNRQAERGADRRWAVVAISGSGDRPRRRSFHQGAAHVLGRLGRLCRHPHPVHLE
jgi:fumarylacetoacetate (FAA) hydrolase family protein